MKNTKNTKLTAYQIYLNIEAEVKASKPKMELPQAGEKCPIHGSNWSKNCRQCKKLRIDVQDNDDKQIDMDLYYYAKGDRGNNVFPAQEQQQSRRSEGVLNSLNALLRQTISNCAYYRDVQQIRTYYDLIAEAERVVTNVETWAIGGEGVPSSFFCILYKFMNMNLSGKIVQQLIVDQVKQLAGYPDSKFVRCIGLLYIRYGIDPNFLWAWMKSHILDLEIIHPCIDKTISMTIGEYVEMLLTDLNYYNTRLPRIPQQIETVIQAKILLAREKRERIIINTKIISLLTKGAKVRAISNQDEEWHLATIINVDGVHVNVTFDERNEKISLGELEFIPQNEEQTQYIATQITQGIQTGEINMASLQMDNQANNQYNRSSSESHRKQHKHKKSRSRSHKKRSRSNHKKHKKSNKKDKKNKKRKYSSSSSSSSSSPPRKTQELKTHYESNKQREERLLIEVRKKQQEKAVTNSRDNGIKNQQKHKKKSKSPDRINFHKNESSKAQNDQPVVQIKQQGHSLDQDDKINNDYV